MLNNIVGVLGVGGGVATNFDSIQTYTVAAGGQSSITFSSIPSTYQHLQIRFMGKLTAADDIYIQFNGDTTTSNYSRHTLYGNGSAAGSYYQNTQISVIYTPNTEVNGGILDILDYTNTNKYKVTRALGGGENNTNGFIALQSGLWRNTNAISSIRLYCGSANFSQYSHFALYGIKA